MEEKHYDVCVIGGGPAGYAAAMRALDYGKSVVLIEKDRLGGAGIWNGALSSKTFWELSHHYRLARQRAAKYHHNYPAPDFISIANEINESIYERRSQIEHHNYWLAKGPQADLFTCIRGQAHFVGLHRVEVVGLSGQTTRVCADHFVLATGSRPRVLADMPTDEQHIMTSDGMSRLKAWPKSILIVGAGVIGCEFTTIFSNFGQTKVFLLANSTHILPQEDEEISTVIEANMLDAGVVIHRKAKLLKLCILEPNIADSGHVEYEVLLEDGSKLVNYVEKVLICVGRLPNTQDLNLELVGVQTDAQGYVLDDDTVTNVPHIYAAGDLTSDIALVNVGELEGRHAVDRMFACPKPLVYNNISTIMFLNPEVAAVGLNEKQALCQQLPYRVASLDYSCIARAVAMRQTQGFFKILVSDDEHMHILGMRAVGEHASSAIQAVALLIYMKKGIGELAELIHPHPSIIEGVQECARMFMGTSIFKPSIFRQYLRCHKVSAEGICEDFCYEGSVAVRV